MTNNIRKKSSRHRGSFTHGHGEKKKRRGAGHRGGRGNAGSGKRGDAKKPSYWKDTKYMGKFGFTNPTTKDVNTISIAQLNSSIENLVAEGFATKNQNKFTINLTAMNCDKLLGTGKPVAQYVISVAAATVGAIEKIKAAGGEVIIAVKEVKEVKPKAEVKKPAKSEPKVEKSDKAAEKPVEQKAKAQSNKVAGAQKQKVSNKPSAE